MSPERIISSALTNWIPYKLLPAQPVILCRWLYSGTQAYTEPFFDETINKLKVLPENRHPQKSVTSLQMLADWGAIVDAVSPSALIFHVSRCGSTLVSQTLSRFDATISLAEVPVFDEILKLQHNIYSGHLEQVNVLLSGAVRLYGARRTGSERHYFIKTDCWHLMYYFQLRSLFPDTPFVILYRHPAEVLDSNRRKKGIQSIAGIVGPEVYGFHSLTPEEFNPDVYFGLVLEKFFRSILDIADRDPNMILLNYNQGLDTIMRQITARTNVPYTAREQALTASRALYSAKTPRELFKEENVAMLSHPSLGTLLPLYDSIEQVRSVRYAV